MFSIKSIITTAVVATVSVNAMELNHFTNEAAAKAITNGQFRIGHGGWCGPGVYFVKGNSLKHSKQNPRFNSRGAYSYMIHSEVDTGKVCRNVHKDICNQSKHTAKNYARRHGCGTIEFINGDGVEYVVFDVNRIHPKYYKNIHSNERHYRQHHG
eukprot:Pgem_evm1s10734